MMNDDIVEPRIRLPGRPVKGSQKTAAQGRWAAHSETVRRAGLPRGRLPITPRTKIRVTFAPEAASIVRVGSSYVQVADTKRHGVFISGIAEDAVALRFCAGLCEVAVLAECPARCSASTALSRDTARAPATPATRSTPGMQYLAWYQASYHDVQDRKLEAHENCAQHRFGALICVAHSEHDCAEHDRGPSRTGCHSQEVHQPAPVQYFLADTRRQTHQHKGRHFQAEGWHQHPQATNCRNESGWPCAADTPQNNGGHDGHDN